MNHWEKAKAASSIIAAIGIPVVIAIMGNVFTTSMKEREIQGRFVELAVEILAKEPTPESKNIRSWATKVINLYSGVELDTQTQQDLIERVPLVDSAVAAAYPGLRIPEASPGELRIVDDLIVGEDAEYHIVPKTSGQVPLDDLKAIVIHFTAGSSLDRSVEAFRDPNLKASSHLLIGRDGSIIQLVPFNYSAWHAGRSQYGGLTGFNRLSIGIQLENPGKLDRTSSGEYRTWFGGVVEPDQVVEATHKHQTEPAFWHRYTDEQIAATRRVCALLVEQYGIEWILGNEDIARGRKYDPGPAFPMAELQTAILGHTLD